MLRAVSNSVLVQIGNTFIRDISNITKGSYAYAHSSKLNPADYAQIVGKVVSVPKMITNFKPGYTGFTAKDIRKNDTAIFRYDVVYAFKKDNSGFKNLFWYKGKQYWAADITKIFGVIRDEKIIMINGYCMVEDLKAESKIILPHHIKDTDSISYGTLTQIGDNLMGFEKVNAHSGDKVYFDPNVVQHYEKDGFKFGILRQKDILAVDVAEWNALKAV